MLDDEGTRTMAGAPKNQRSARHRLLVSAIIKSGSERIESLAEQLAVSQVTVYRDVQHLVERGILRLDRGEVSVRGTSTVELPPQIRSQQSAQEKEAIAKVAAEFVSPNMAIMVDDSSSALPLVPLLADLAPLTLITNSLTVQERSKETMDIDVVLTGGRLRRWANALYGTLATDSLDGIRADICFMSDAAISDGGIYNPIDYVIDMKRKMLSRSKMNILLIDSHKFGRRAWQETAPLSVFDVIITDSNTAAEQLEDLSAYAEVRVAGVVAGGLTEAQAGDQADD